MSEPSEFKATVAVVKAIADRTVTGYCAVMGNIDSGNDRLWPGTFNKTIAESRKRIRHLWMHDSYNPPIATVDALREAPREELPQELLGQFPQAMSALEVTRTYLTFPAAEAVFQGIKSGAISEMSFGFDPVKMDFETIDGYGQVRNIRECRLWDTSDVTWGMNAATLAAKGALSTEAALTKLANLTATLKSGRVLSAANRQLVQNAIEALQALVQAAEPQTDAQTSEKAGTPADALTVLRMRHEHRKRSFALISN